MKNLKDVINNFLEIQANKRIDENPDEYFLGSQDYGVFNNGVGFSSYGSEKVYDTCKAYEDAQDEMIETLNACAGVNGCYVKEDLLNDFLALPEINELLKMLVLGKISAKESDTMPELETAGELASNFFNALTGKN